MIYIHTETKIISTTLANFNSEPINGFYFFHHSVQKTHKVFSDSHIYDLFVILILFKLWNLMWQYDDLWLQMY